MQNNILEFVLKARDEASAKVTAFGKKVNDLQPAFQKMATAGTVAFAGITAVIGTSIKAYAEAEVANKRLDTIAKQVTKSTEAEIQGFKDLATALQKVGVVEDDVVIAGQSQLASFTKNSQVVSQLSDDLADLAVAQYGTNVSQEQAIQTANLMGKALSGNLGALTRTGILVSGEFRTAFENANTEQEKAVILSKIIQDNYGGLNKAMRDTAEGGLQVLKNSFGDMQETLGATFIPLLNQLVQKIIPVVDSIALWVQENPELARNIILASLAIAGLVAVVGFLGLALPMIIAGFTLLLGPVGLVIAIIGALAFAVTNVVKIMLILQNDSKLIWEGIKAIFKESIESIIGFFKPFMDILDKVFDKISRITSGLSSVKQSIGGKVSSFFSGGKAQGGNVVSGSSYLVGENGPEYFTPRNSGMIGTGAGAGGGSYNFSININGGMITKSVAGEIGDLILEKFKQTTRI